jgi:AcrR family transcriptional regulator
MATVNKNIPVDTKKPRGRPRAFDKQAALDAALGAFWSKGYASTSLDELTEAMGISRPSLYAAFGDKQALFTAALTRYSELAVAEIGPSLLRRDLDLKGALGGFYANAIRFFTAPDRGPLGCLISTVAAAEARAEPFIAAAIAGHRERVRIGLTRRFEAASAAELPASPDIDSMVFVATALLQGFAAAARAGMEAEQLQARVPAAVRAVVAAA